MAHLASMGAADTRPSVFGKWEILGKFLADSKLLNQRGLVWQTRLLTEEKEKGSHTSVCASMHVMLCLIVVLAWPEAGPNFFPGLCGWVNPPRGGQGRGWRAWVDFRKKNEWVGLGPGKVPPGGHSVNLCPRFRHMPESAFGARFPKYSSNWLSQYS